MRGNILSFEALASKIHLTQLCENSFLRISCDSCGEVQKFDQTGTADGEQSLLHCQEYSNFSIFPKIPSIGSYSRRHNCWTNVGRSNCEISWRMWDRSCDSVSCWSCEHILRCDIQRNRVFCEWSSWPQRRAHSLKRKESHGEERGSNSIKESCAHESNKETCANPRSNPIIDSLFKKSCHSYKWEELDYHCSQPFTKNPRRSRRWYVITIKTNANKTDHIIGRPWNRYCWRCLRRRE